MFPFDSNSGIPGFKMSKFFPWEKINWIFRHDIFSLFYFVAIVGTRERKAGSFFRQYIFSKVLSNKNGNIEYICAIYEP